MFPLARESEKQLSNLPAVPEPATGFDLLRQFLDLNLAVCTRSYSATLLTAPHPTKRGPLGPNKESILLQRKQLGTDYATPAMIASSDDICEAAEIRTNFIYCEIKEFYLMMRFVKKHAKDGVPETLII